jgi:glycosyltransferase involved in cell wall biosynthesis
MRVAIVSTYPPRPCGIGIFSRDLRSALGQMDPSVHVEVVPIVREPGRHDNGEVVTAIRQDVRSDYVAAARLVDGRDTDVVLVEHEYGIFGGEAGSYVLSLVEQLSLPLVVTLHTVLSQPSVRQAETLRALCHRATLVTVFTETARRMVLEARLVPPERVRVVPHGAPATLLPASPGSTRDGGGPGEDTRHRRGKPALRLLDGRTVLSTFGLISPGKGIEVAIRALPKIVTAHPDVLYLVAGQTHPEVVKAEGERYRLDLERLVRDLELTEHVQFVDRFLSTGELSVLLRRTALYLTPYRSREQIVSGALTFAVVAGCPVVSTPYFYAEDLLSSGAGVLTPFGEPDAFADAVLGLLDDPAALEAARTEAGRVGARLTWPAVGAQMLDVLSEALALGPVGSGEEVLPAASSPRIRPDHLITLVDDVGIVQHADGVVPDLVSGYCVDDVARLVVVAIGLQRELGEAAYGRMLTRGVAFLRHAHEPGRLGLRNLMAYDRTWLDEPHCGDHVGRAVWALGEVVAAQPDGALARPARRLLAELAPALAGAASPRNLAFTVLGLTRPEPEELPEPLSGLLRELADRLAAVYAAGRREDWRWFEDSLTYDNARLPQALIAAGHRLGDAGMLACGLEALDWYAGQCALHTPVVRLVGNGWRRRDQAAGGPDRDEGDEQPLDAAALAEAYVEALAATGRRQHGRLAVRAFEWFLGRNRFGLPVYDYATGGCHDGLGATGLNDNEGAESTLAYLQALLALDAAGLQASLPAS